MMGLSVFSKMTFGALCGFEYAAIFAGESRNPASHLKKAIFVAAPIIALLYIFGASAILAYVSPGNIDVIGPIPQALRVALGGSGLAQTIVWYRENQIWLNDVRSGQYRDYFQKHYVDRSRTFAQ